MKLLVRNVRVQDKFSKHNGSVVDIAIHNGKIEKIGSIGQLDGYQEVSFPNATASVGWMDMRAYVGEPGYEQKETMETLQNAAANAGFTDLAVLPNTMPCVHSREMVENIKLKTSNNLVEFHPYAALTRNFDGVNLTEMVDLNHAGAVGYTDVEPIGNSNTLQLGLQYAIPFNGLVINHPLDKGMSAHKMVHEGEMSTRLGLPGIPVEAEEIMIDRDLRIAEYTKGRIHFSLVNTKKGIEKIAAAKRQGIHVTCDTAAYYLHLTDEKLASFDSNYKVFPPLRSRADADALIEAAKNGVLDVIVSGHRPENQEVKDLEFDQAEYGISALESTFQLINEVLTGDQMLEKLVYNPRTILGLDCPVIEEGNTAKITLYNPEGNTVFDPHYLKSKSKNSPFIGTSLKGQVYGIINNNDYRINA